MVSAFSRPVSSAGISYGSFKTSLITLSYIATEAFTSDVLDAVVSSYGSDSSPDPSYIAAGAVSYVLISPVPVYVAGDTVPLY